MRLSTWETSNTSRILINGTTELAEYEEDQEEIGDAEVHWDVFALIPVRVTLLVLYSIVFIFCVMGNLAVVLVTTLHPKMRNVTKFFLAHLAWANLCVGLFCVYQHLSILLAQRWIFGEFLCKMYHFTMSLSQTASVLILLVTAVERYCVIIHPFTSLRLLTSRRRHAIVAAVWFCSGLLSFHKFYYVTTMNHWLEHGGELEIICGMDVGNFDHKLADMISFVVVFLVPMMVISWLYLRIAFCLRQQGRQGHLWAYVRSRSIFTVQSHTNLSDFRGRPSGTWRLSVAVSDSNNTAMRSNGYNSECYLATTASSSTSHISLPDHVMRIQRAKRQAVRTLISIAVCFAVLNLPFHLRKILQNYSSLYESDDPWLELLTPFTFLLMCANCAVNPFLHALLDRNFQVCLMEVLKCRQKRRQFTHPHD